MAGEYGVRADSRGTRRTGWILASIAGSLTLVIIWWLLRDPETFLRTRLGVTAEVGRLPWAWVLMVAIALGYSAYTVRAVTVVRENLSTWSWLKLIGVWAAICTGIVEEVVFRQMLMDGLMGAGAAVPVQVGVSALLFGLAHASWALLGGQWRLALPVVVATTVLGALLAVLYIVAGRSTLPSISAHILINLVIEPWLILAAVTRTWDAARPSGGPPPGSGTHPVPHTS